MRLGQRCRLAALRAVFALALLHGAGLAGAQEQLAGDPVSARELGEIREAFKGIGLTGADVTAAADGRVALVGEYDNRDQVETAFSVARAVVGLRRVAPTTPSTIHYRMKGFDTAFSSTVARMMQKKPAAAPMATTVAAPVARSTPRTLALVVGAGKNRYLPPKFALDGAVKDAIDFAGFLNAPEGSSAPPESVRVLTQEQATSDAVKAGLKDMIEHTQAGDTAVLFVAAHGLPNAMNKFDIVLYDTEFPQRKVATKGQSLDFVIANRKTALSDDDLQGFVAQMTAKDVRTIVVLDTCYSGKTFVAIPGYAPARTRSLSKHKEEQAYATSLSQEAVADLVQKARDMKTSRIVIVSASENEESLESPALGGGAFTQLYLQSLRRQHDYADAFDTTKPSVIKLARTLGQSQTPRMLVVPETADTRM